MSSSIQAAANAIQQGQAVVFPTDTVYGIGVDPFNATAINLLFAIKRRPLEKGIPILIASVADLEKVVAPAAATHPDLQTLLERFWPGPLTVILKRNPALPTIIAPNDTIAVRIPDHPTARDIIRAAGGAIATSSANHSGAPSAMSVTDAKTMLGDEVTVYIEGDAAQGTSPSTILDCSQYPFKMGRLGPISVANIVQACPSIAISGITAGEDNID